MILFLSAVAHLMPWATACLGVAYAYPLWEPYAVRLHRHIGAVRSDWTRRMAVRGSTPRDPWEGEGGTSWGGNASSYRKGNVPIRVTAEHTRRRS